MFTEEDRNQLKQKGITVDQIEAQISRFENGFPFIRLAAPAAIGNGIIRLEDREIDQYVEYYDRSRPGKYIVKFVPASGAATRMFRDLMAYMKEIKEDEDLPALILGERFPEVDLFIKNLDKFPFFSDLKRKTTEENLDLTELRESGKARKIIDLLVTPVGMNYGQLPKGVLKFHSYGGESRTALEEHFVETADYAFAKDEVRIHFTVSSEFTEIYYRLSEQYKARYEKENHCRFRIEFSFQDPSTDTIAVDMNNEPFRDAKGQLHFRPGGHGALLKNLNEINADLVFIKNIDNVAPDRLKPICYRYKKALGGLLLDIQKQVFSLLTELENRAGPDTIRNIKHFIADELRQDTVQLVSQGASGDERDVLYRYLNRPIRICGMVKNEGEPGGGPYWVQERSGRISLQIVEMSQVDRDDPQQDRIVSNATHFNPVDLVCSFKDHRNRKFDLNKHVDPETGFISEKSLDGRILRALELPGLWNGCMADWITVFVEIPIETFTPVKTVNDLLRPEHQ